MIHEVVDKRELLGALLYRSRFVSLRQGEGVVRLRAGFVRNLKPADFHQLLSMGKYPLASDFPEDSGPRIYM